MGDHQTRVLARKLAVLEQQIRLRKQPSLAYSSIDDGALLATDSDGNTTMVIGVQHDGTNTAAPVTGPTPPKPTLPMVTSAPGGLRVYWDGTFADGSVAPMDFARVVVYAVPTSVYTGPDPLNQTIIVGALTSATGGEITAGLNPEEHAVYLVCWSQAGKFSLASDVALGSPSAVVDQAAIDAVQAAADAADAKASQAAADASQAALDAAAADANAAQAADDAATAAGLVADKAVVRIQGATPGVADQNANTLWIDTSGTVSAFDTYTPPATATGSVYSRSSRLKINVAGSITAVKFWRGAGAPDSRTVRLYDGAGTLLASKVTAEAGAPEGWFTATLDTPVAVAANDEIVPTYDAPASETIRYATSGFASDTPQISYVRGQYAAGAGVYPSTNNPGIFYATDVVLASGVGGSNTPKRWDGTAWVAISDALAVQAAADAAQAAADAAAADAKADAAADAAQAAHDAADAAESLATSKSTVYRQPTAPWPDDPTGLEHADDVGDMWVNTAPGPGPLLDIINVTASGGVVTVRTGTEHLLSVGKAVEITGAPVDRLGLALPPELLSTWTVTAVSGVDSFSFSAPTVNNMPDTATTGGIAQGLDVRPLNRPSIWDGSLWQNVQDSGAEAAQTLQDDVKVAQIDLIHLAATATDAYRTAYTADGRVAISDYEPGPEDVEGKQDGSLWITRTRDRINDCVNPSFETGVTGWTPEAATVAQVNITPTDDLGSKAARVTNTSAAGSHNMRTTAALPVADAEEITASGFMRSVSGGATGYYVYLTWLNASNAVVGTTIGTSIDLLVPSTETGEAWKRAYVSGTAPVGVGVTQVMVGFSSPAASAVWELEGVLIERTARLGRFFDGSSEGGSWENPAAPGVGVSELDGGAIIRLFNLEDGSWQEKFWTADTIASVNVQTLRIDKDYKRPAGLGKYMDGGLLADHTVSVDKLYAPTIACTEAIAAGSLVNVTNVGGAFVIRKAKAAPGYEAHGFVLVAGAIGQEIPVYTSGYNPLMSGLTPGKLFLSATPGQATPVAPTAAGSIVQVVGSGVAATTLNFAARQAVTIGS